LSSGPAISAFFLLVGAKLRMCPTVEFVREPLVRVIKKGPRQMG
jgi:hypothetical protein